MVKAVSSQMATRKEKKSYQCEASPGSEQGMHNSHGSTEENLRVVPHEADWRLGVQSCGRALAWLVWGPGLYPQSQGRGRGAETIIGGYVSMM